MLKTQSKYKYWIPVAVLVTGIFFSCVNDLEKIKAISSVKDAPDESSTDLHVVYTDSGFAKVEINAKLAESYREQGKTKLKDGLRVKFYDEVGKVTSILSAQYGEIDEKSGDMFVRDSVELFNVEKDKVLETEELFWSKEGDSIYTDKSVVIKSKDLILYGIGLRTTQAFDTAYIYNPKAKVKRNLK